jgi:ubiquinone/menaquinone biosynthesis C-methylase UbiE
MSSYQYAFADIAQEQRRLATQAELLDPLTERVFREVGLGTGMRVLELGSGAGDVAMLAARLVGREGEVVWC